MRTTLQLDKTFSRKGQVITDETGNKCRQQGRDRAGKERQRVQSYILEITRQMDLNAEKWSTTSWLMVGSHKCNNSSMAGFEDRSTNLEGSKFGVGKSLDKASIEFSNISVPGMRTQSVI